MPRSSNFTTTGLKELKNPPRVTRISFPAIHDFEKEILFQNSTYMEMSAELQTTIQQDVQSIFFDWMMSKRVKRQTTTPVVKRKMYENIMEKILASVEVESVTKPAFKGEGNFDLQFVDQSFNSGVCHFENLPVTGVIPFSRPIQLHCMPYSKPQTPSSQSVLNFSESEEEMFPDGCMPFSEPLSPTLESLSFINKLQTFSLPVDPVAADTAATGSTADSSELMNISSVFEILPFPGVADTLRDIWNIQAHISQVLNKPSIDQFLGPNDW